MSADVAPGPDGRSRCAWCLSAPDYVEYHDTVWGRPLHDERALFEALTLELFQSGLSWLTILRKREGFRAAFADWRIERVAAFGERDVERLLQDASIVRHRAKIEATVANGRAVVELSGRGVSFADLVWSFAPDREPGHAPQAMRDLPTATAESKAMAKELKRLGFRFVGPTTAYSFMQSAGLVNDHLAGCEFRGDPESVDRRASAVGSR